MVQRLPEEGNWSGFQFSQASNMFVQLKNGGEIKVPVSHQQRRLLDLETEDSHHAAPGAKRSKLMDMPDVSFKPSGAWTSGDNTPFEPRPPSQIRNRLPVSAPHPLDEPSPLGLTLKKTPSFLDLLSMALGQGYNEQPGDNSSQGTANRAGIPSACPSQGKIKASNFGAASLRIGSWERISRYEGDVVAKCYYAKRKLVWEVLENGLKSKIELQWSDISAIKASYGEGQSGMLEVEVSRPPLFFKETNPQPRKHTLWEATSDFTGGEATVCKRHVLRFPEGVLNKHYEKLLQCDARLKALAMPNATVSHQRIDEVKREDVNSNSAQPLDAVGNRPLASPKVKLEVTEKGRSPSSVMESRGSDDSDTEETAATTNAELNKDEVDQKPSRGMATFVLAGSDNEVLNEIAQILLGESNAARTTPESGGASGMFRVSSLTGLFEDGTGWSSYSVSDWNDPAHGNEGYALDERLRNNTTPNVDENDSSGLFELDPSGERPTSLQESVRQCFTRHGSSGDLLVNLPRIASLPQLFENGLIRRDSQLSLLEFS